MDGDKGGADRGHGYVMRDMLQTRGTRQDHDDSETDAPPPSPQQQEKSRRRRRLLIIGGVVLALAVLAGGTLYWLHARHFESTDDAFIDGHVTQMSAQVAGRVTALLVADNAHVAAGEKLLLLDPRDFSVKLDQAKAKHGTAFAQLAQARAQVAVQQANADQATANLQVAEAELVQAEQDYTRFHAIDPKAVTRQEVDNATAAQRSATAKRDAARQAISAGNAQVAAARAQVGAAEAALRDADAGVEAAELQLSYTTISAPAAGHIARRTVEVGNYVNPGQALFALVQDEVWVTANFKETQLDVMHPGQRVAISVDAYPQISFRGHVESFQRGTGSVFSALPAENATGNYVKVVQRVPVRIVFDDDRIDKYPLSPGMSVTPSVDLRTK